VTQSPPDMPSTTSGDRRRQTSGTAPFVFHAVPAQPLDMLAQASVTLNA
jgi:hypothetical protein